MIDINILGLKILAGVDSMYQIYSVCSYMSEWTVLEL